MNQKLSINNGDEHNIEQSTVHFYMETIELERLSPLAFYEAGETIYSGNRFYWQNREKTFTLVGLGHAYTIMNDESNDTRYETVEQKWANLLTHIDLTNEKQQPILFGGFTFDPLKGKSKEWHAFPHTFFTLATHQLVIRNEKTFVTTMAVTEKPLNEQEKQQLLSERDEFLHCAQVRGSKTYAKPVVQSFYEPYKEAYLQSIKDVTNVIQQKKADKIVIARSLALTFEGEVTSTNVLSQIITEQQESYLFGFESEESFFFGASPERLVMVKDRDAYSSCVAGSIKRGTTKDADDLLGASLLNDAKNLVEHQYVVDMIRTAFEESCATYKLPNGPQLLKIRDIQHLFTPIEGTLKKKASILQLVKQLHPTPALGGAPRGEAMTYIRQFEPTDRGVYAAPIGWLNADGDGEFAVAIRSALLDENRAYLYAGGGIVADSEPMSEYEETLVKFRPMLRALGGNLNDE